MTLRVPPTCLCGIFFNLFLIHLDLGVGKKRREDLCVESNVGILKWRHTSYEAGQKTSTFWPSNAPLASLLERLIGLIYNLPACLHHKITQDLSSSECIAATILGVQAHLLLPVPWRITIMSMRYEDKHFMPITSFNPHSHVVMLVL